MEKEEICKKIAEEEDYIKSPKFSNSLAKFTARYSEGVDNSTIARVLMLTEEEVEKIYQESLEILREELVNEET